MVSDILEEETDCEDIFQSAQDYSTRLFEAFAQLDPVEEKAKDDLTKSLKNFYFTHTQQAQFIKLLESYLRRNEIQLETFLNLKDFVEIDRWDAEPKERTKRLIDFLEKDQDPISFKAREFLDSLIHATNIKLGYDRKLERNELTLEAKLKSQADIEKLTRELHKLDMDKVQEIFQGQFDVQ